MLRDIFTCFIGTYRVYVNAEDRLSAVNLMHKHNMFCSHTKVCKNGDYTFSVTSLTFHKLKLLFKENGISFSSTSIKGFPQVIKFLIKRPGIIVGCVIFLAFMWWTSRTIWSIEVTGNSNVSDDEIISMLDDLGCGYGDYIPDIDFDMLHARFIAKSENISWIAVNMKGNHANVEVLEIKPGATQPRDEGVFANLVAKEDAQIALVKTVSGVSSVTPGDIVKKGEILVSGVIGVREDRVRYEYAEGEILAYVPRTIEITIPFENLEKTYTGNEYTENSVKIFKKSINLFTKGGIEYTIYDKIIDNRQVMLFGQFPLPVWSEKVTYKEYEYVSVNNSYEKTVAAAMAELRICLDEILETSEIISNKVITEITDEAFVIKYDMICLADIAETREFSADERNQLDN